GASCFVLLKKLKDPVQQKTLIGAAILCMAVGLPFLVPPVNAAIIGLFCLMFKVAVLVYIMIWFRGTFPRFRYDQLMNIGWKYMIPIGIGALVVNAILGMTRYARLANRQIDYACSPVGLDRASVQQENLLDHRADRERVRHKTY